MNEYVGITGSSGVLGTIFKKEFRIKKIPYSCFEGDICSTEDIKKWISGKTFTSIIHLAAIVATKDVKDNPERAFEVNVIGTKNLAEVLSNLNTKPWLFYASSSHVYKSKSVPIYEEDTIEPISEYGRTKYEGEKALNGKYPNLCIGRIFSFYHSTQKKPFLYPTILERLQTEDLTKPFKLFGAESVRDFLNAEEVVKIVMRLLEEKKTGILNIASGEGIKIKDFTQSLTKVKLNIEETGERDYLVADIGKLKKTLDI
jgi:nucleoside-diphosphate-sugar epimerase